MALKRSQKNSNYESAKKQKHDSKEFLKHNENKPELVIDLTEEYTGPEKRLEIMVHACRNGQIGVVEQLLKLGFDVNSRDSSNNTALHHSSANGHEKIVEMLLINGADPDLTNESQFSPLHLASLNGHTKVIKELLKYNIHVDFYNYHGENALSFAARNGHLNAVKELLNSGAKAYIESNNYSRFHVLEKLPSVLSENHIEIAAEILKYHPLPIHQALEQLQSPETYLIIRHLFKSGISPDLQDRNGKTALHRAILKGVNSQIFVELLKHGSNMEINDINNESPLHLAFKHHNYEFVQELLKYGANPNHQTTNDGYGSTLLHEACEHGNLLLTKILLEHGADVNAADNHKQTPIHLAIIEGIFGEQEIEVIKELLRNGANVNLKDSDGFTPLHEAAFKTMPEVLFQNILKRCTNLDIKHFEGQTSLHMAIGEGCQSNVKNLLRYGANPNVRDFERDSSLEIALKCKQIDTFKMLIHNN